MASPPQSRTLSPAHERAKDYLARLIWDWKGKDLASRMSLSDKTLARQIGVASPTFSEWITGSKLPNIESSIAISRFFGVDPKETLEIFGHAEHPPPATLESVSQFARHSVATEPHRWEHPEATLHALGLLLDPAWQAQQAPVWRKITLAILDSKEALYEKALMLARIVEADDTARNPVA